MAMKQRMTVTIIVMGGLSSSFGADMENRQTEYSVEREGNSSQWSIVNDGVMGGISQSRSSMTDRGTLLFSGVVSLENNGGFASIRHDSQAFGIGPGDGIRLRVKGDGKTYQLRVRTSERFDGIAYKVDFITLQEAWQDIEIPWERFTATYRGRTVEGAPELKGQQIHQVGFLIADKQAGPFELEVEFLGPIIHTE